MPSTAACPQIERYQALAAGQMSEADKETLLTHLEGCPRCAERLGSLAHEDTLLELLRQTETLNDHLPRETIQRLIERVRNLGPGVRPAAVAEEKTLPPLEVAPAAALVVACPGCGKKLRAKSELAGKKVKCPQCQQPVPIPAGPAKPAAVKTMAETPVPARVGETMAEPKEPTSELYDFLAPPEQADELGRLGSYRVLKVLGTGGMGVVFRAEDPQLQRPVALKAMLPSLATSGSAKQRFLREARAAAAIKHDHIVAIYQVGEDRGSPFLAMEFLEGEPLDERLQREKILPIPEVLRIGREMAEGLAAAHERGLIHRDIKPANVWLEGKRGRAKILDFGLARAAQEEVHLTQSGAIVGTPAYMAPEQAQARNPDHRADLFSLGCVLYVMCTGDRPFKGQDTLSILMALAIHEPPPPRQLNPAVPQALSDLILRLLAKEPDGRPASAQDVAEALRGIEQDPNLALALPAGATRKGTGPAPRRRSRAMLLAGLVLAVAAAVAAAAVYLFRVSTPEGDFYVEVADDAVAVAIDKQGGLRLIDRKTKKEYLIKARQSQKLPAGDYELVITDPDAGLEYSALTFAIKGKDTPASVRVWFKKAVAKIEEPPPASQDNTDWVRLFNGKDLTGWYGSKAFRVEGDELVADASKGGWLLTLQDYADYILRLEFQLSPKANSGIALRARPDKAAEGNLLEVQIYDDGASPRLAAGMKTGALYGLQDPHPLADLKPVGEWNRMEIELRGPSLQVAVNGKSVLRANLQELKASPGSATDVSLNATKGRIGLQAHNTAVRFRNIEIKERPASSRTDSPQETVGEVRRFRHADNVQCVASSPDSKRILAGDQNGLLKLWDVETGQEEASWQAHEAAANIMTRPAAVTSVCFSPTDNHVAVSAGRDGQIRFWDLRTRQEIRALPRSEPNYWHCAAFSPDGKLLVCAGKHVRVLDALSGKELHRVEPPQEGDGSPGKEFYDAKFVDDRRILIAPKDHAMQLHDWKAGKSEFTFLREEQAVAIAISPGGRFALTGQFKAPKSAVQQSVRFWNLQEPPTPSRAFVGHTGNVAAAAISPDGRRGLTGGWDGTMRLWDLPSGKELHCFEVSNTPTELIYRNFVNAVAFSPDGRHAVSGAGSKMVQVWRLPDAAAKPPPPLEPVGEVRRLPHSTWVTALACCADGQQVLSGDKAGMLRLWNLKTGQEVASWQGHKSGTTINCVRISPTDDNLALSCGEDGTLRLWDLAKGQEIRTLLEASAEITSWSTSGGTGLQSADFSPDGKFAVCGGKELWVFEVPGGKQVHHFESRFGFSAVAFCDDRLILYTANSTAPTLRDWKEGKNEFAFHKEDQSFRVAVSRDGRLALTGHFGQHRNGDYDYSAGSRVRSWDLQDRTKPPRVFTGHVWMVLSVAISPDGRRGLSGSDDGTMRLWDLTTGKELVCFDVSPQGQAKNASKRVYCVTFTPDGRYALSGGGNKLLQVWRLPDPEPQ
jgi:WD40 repeat protein